MTWECRYPRICRCRQIAKFECPDLPPLGISTTAKRPIFPNLHTNVMLDQHEKEIEKIKKDVEKLKDSTRDIKFSNGNGTH